ncbi:MAG: hypothetical protein Q9170_004248 [Blastenia crenularia]
MPRKGTPDPTIFLTWAAEVSLAQLVSRILAYADTKAAITTFRLAARDGPHLGNLPEEVLSMIASEVQESAFAKSMTRYVQKGKCLTDDCSTLSHFSPEEFASGDLGCDRCSDDSHFEKSCWEESREIHNDTVERHRHMLQNLEGKSRFAKAVQIFIADFDVEPYFLIRKYWCRDRGILEDVEVSAYLMLPLYEIPMQSTLGDETGDFGICSTLDQTIGLDLTETQRDSFRHASRALKMHAYDPDEDESAYELKPAQRSVVRQCNPSEGSDWDHEAEREDETSSELAEEALSQAEKVGSHGTSSTRNGTLEQDATEKQDETSGSADPTQKAVAESTSARKPQKLIQRLMILGCGELAAGLTDW